MTTRLQIKWRVLGGLLAAFFTLCGCRGKDTATIAENAVTPPPVESVVRGGWRWSARLASEEPAAGMAVGAGQTVLFHPRRLSLNDKKTLRSEDLGISGGFLDAIFLDDGRLLVIGSSCATCESAKPVWMTLNDDGTVIKGGAGEAFLRAGAYAWIAKGPNQRFGIVVGDSTATIRFATWTDKEGLSPFVQIDSQVQSAGIAVDPLSAEPWIVGEWNRQLAIWTRKPDGGFTRSVLGRLARTDATTPPIPLAGPGRAPSVVAPSAEVLGSEALYLYSKKGEAWEASKIGFTSEAITYAATIGGDGVPYLFVRGASNGTLYDLRELNTPPRVIPEAGGNGPARLSVDADGRILISLWSQGRIFLISREADS